MRTAFRILFTVLAATCGSVLLVMLFWETVFRTRRWIEFNPLADLYMSNHVAAEAISRGVVVLLPATALAVVIYSILGVGSPLSLSGDTMSKVPLHPSRSY